MFFPILKSKKVLFFLCLCFILVITAIVLIVDVFPKLITSKINENVQLQQHSEQYDRFLDLPFPLMFQVYIFNVENPDAIINGAKPIVKEMGPYVYKEYTKKIINFTNDQDDTLSFYQSNRFEFDSKASGKFSDEDVVTILNLPMLSVLETIEDSGHSSVLPLFSKCLKSIFADLDTLFIKVKVKDVLLNGIHFCPKQFSLCALVKDVTCKIVGNKRSIYKRPDGTLQFTFLNYKINNHNLITIKRGITEIQTLGNIIKVNNSTFTDIWALNSSCNEVKGRDATLYPPQITKDTILDLYSVDICRSVQMKFSKESVYKNINGLTFLLDNETLRDATIDKETNCFCANKTRGINDEETCYLDGVLDLQPCLEAPVLLSLPHFLWADKQYIQNVDGIFPNETLHRTFVTIEPNTGIPLNGMTRMQINAVVRPVNIKGLKNVTRTVLPLIWLEEGFSLNDKYIDQLNNMYFKKVMILDITKWTFFGTSTFLTVALATYYLHF